MKMAAGVSPPLLIEWFIRLVFSSEETTKAPKYQTAYACEGKKLTIECDPGDLINLIRANYGRFSITICNDHGNVEWSVNCMSPKSLRVLNSRCAHKQSCSVLATTTMFGDPCAGTHKYLEAHYQCISAAQTSTTTSRPSPPWVLTNTPPLVLNNSGGNEASWSYSSTVPPSAVTPASSPNRLKTHTTNKNNHRHEGPPPPPPIHHHHLPSGQSNNNGAVQSSDSQSPATATNGDIHLVGGRPPSSESTSRNTTNIVSNNNGATADPNKPTNNPNTRILTGVGGAGIDDSSVLIKNRNNNFNNQYGVTTQSAVTAFSNDSMKTSDIQGTSSTVNKNINNINNYNAGIGNDEDEQNLFCGPATSRNLFWNVTRIGEVNVQPCPGGATGIAKWRCVLMHRLSDNNNELDSDDDCSINSCDSENSDKQQLSSFRKNFQPTWHPTTPDLTQCRSLWLNNLEVRVNQRDSSLISIANDLSEVTSSKTLYGGDMLVTTKIIQTMSQKMFYDMETFPDQRQREAIIYELLHGVVKTGSNLLDESQLSSWLDLNLEDQMRVATSLLTGLEDNAFLLADTIIRERNVVQKVKNILLSVRVLETKNIQSNEVFPDLEQWQISDDRIELPRGALIENSEGGLVRIVFAAFDRLESILKPTYDHFDLKSSRNYVRNSVALSNDTQLDSSSNQRVRILNSKVISASLGKGRHIQLSQPIKLVLRHLKTENVSNPTCVFWNYIDHAWSANGCNLESTNRTHSICMCNHLTNFAILMDVLDENNHSLLSLFDSDMRILIYISISVCVLFVIIAILTLKLFNGVFVKSTRTSIYRSIYVCLFIIEILFLLGIEQNESSLICGFTAVFVHCFVLSAAAWFCFEALQSYITLTTDDMLLEVEKSSKIIGYYLMSYGFAFTIVAISLAIDPSTYTQNDFCVLIESNALFYTTFLAPVILFVMGALCYTFLAWFVMCKKSRTTLKNKEHTRLANVRFDIRCSFIFLILLSTDFSCAYIYLRKAKMEEQSANIFGYLFITFNTMLGIYIFVFHCIQNEKIRREYRKYVRQNSWLPKCLRCSKTSISSSAGNYAGASGTSGVGVGPLGTNHKKKQPLVGTSSVLPGNSNDDAASIIGSGIATEIMASSDCELNIPTPGRHHQMAGGLKISSEGVIPGSLKSHGKTNSIIESVPGGHIVLERIAGNTLRSGVSMGHHTPSGGHASPTSSAGSTHLIFGPKQGGAGGNESYYHQPSAEYYSAKHLMGSSDAKNFNSPATPYDDKFLYFDGNSKRIKTGVIGSGSGYPTATTPRSMAGTACGGLQMQQNEYFYWTQKNNHHHQKKKHANGTNDSHKKSQKSDIMHIFYPSYKKTTTMLKNHPHSHYPQPVLPPPPMDGDESAAVYHRPQQHHHHRQLSTHQLSSDEDHGDSSTHHLMHLISNGGCRGGANSAIAVNSTGGGNGSSRGCDGGSISSHPSDCFSPDGNGSVGVNINASASGGQPYHHRHYRNKHSNCDLTNDFGGGSMASGSESYYNQGSLGDGPVYEEILSNRNSVMQDDVEDNADDSLCEDEEDDEEGEEEDIEDEEEEDDDGDIDDDVENRIMEEEKYNRMRRMMAIKDENLKRQRFHRKDNKNPAGPYSPHRSGGGDFVDSYPHPHQRQLQQQHQQHTVFGGGGLIGLTGSGGGPLPQMPGGSMRSFKKSPNRSAISVSDMFNHHPSSSSNSSSGCKGPPLPPANQHPMHLRQQHSPQSQTSGSLQQQQHTLHQYPIGRNISAMLDENNTVRCYLEPLPK